MKKVIATIGIVLLIVVVVETRSEATDGSCVPPPAGLISWWSGEGNADDRMNNNPGIAENGTTYGPGMVGQAFLFDGVDDYVAINDSLSLKIGFSDYTIAAWIKTTDPSNSRIFSKGDWNYTTGYTMRISGGKAYLGDASNWNLHVNLEGNTTVTDGFWHYIVGVVDRDVGAAVYVDGSLDATQAIDNPAYDLSNDRNPTIGVSDGWEEYPSEPEYFNGAIDEVAIYSRALSEAEIQAIYNAGTAGKCNTQVSIDIKPGSYPNSINPCSRGKIPVAILTTDTFDASTVDPSTVLFGSICSQAAPVRSALEDVDGDGDIDLILHFNTQEMWMQYGDDSAFLTGGTVSGETIYGFDSIQTVECKKCFPSPAGMTGWWPGDGNTDDIIGGRSAVLQGDATTGPGFIDQAFFLDGDGDFVDVPHDEALELGTRDFTVDLWVLFNETDREQVLVEKWIQRFSGPSEGWTLTKLEGNVLRLAMADMSGNEINVDSAVLPIATGTWTHFAATRRGSQVTLFMNGVPVAKGVSPLNLNSTSSLKFGHRGNPADTQGSEDDRGFFLNGRIDEVELFVGQALTHCQIQAIFNAGSAGMCKKTSAATYDLAADWSDAANPNGVWTYREGTNALPSVPDWTPLEGSVVQPAWAPSAEGGNFLPAWFQSTANNPIGLDILLGDVVVHSTDEGNGPYSGVANVIWTSPINGVINICGAVWMARDIGRDNIWTLLRNGVTLTSGNIFSGDPFNRATPFAFTKGSGGPKALERIAVSIGDVIELRIEKTSGPGDFVGVNLTIAKHAGMCKKLPH